MTKKLELKNKSIQSLKEDLHQLSAKCDIDKYGYESKQVEWVSKLSACESKELRLTREIELLEEQVKKKKEKLQVHESRLFAQMSSEEKTQYFLNLQKKLAKSIKSCNKTIFTAKVYKRKRGEKKIKKTYKNKIVVGNQSLKMYKKPREEG